jgi:hypothetical protein
MDDLVKDKIAKWNEKRVNRGNERKKGLKMKERIYEKNVGS